MLKRVLVPLDGSARAEQGLPVAARLAQAVGGTVVLLRVVTIPNEFVAYVTLEPIATQSVINATLEEARTSLERLTGSDSLAGVHTETEVLLGQAAATILSVVDSHHIDLIVLCSHSYTGMTRWMLGSVAEKVSQLAPVPVLVLREDGPVPVPPLPQEGGPLRVLIPLDGSVRAQAAIIPAAQLIAALSAPAQGALHLTRVVALPAEVYLSQWEREAILQQAKQYLSSLADQMREGLLASPVADLKVSLTWSVTIDTDIAAAIIRGAEQGEEAEGAGVSGSSQVIAMATHGYSGLQRWVMGSITQRVLHGSKLPLLIVRPPDMADKGQQI
jgi:nucleotide-binding universal stress UspA family protein